MGTTQQAHITTIELSQAECMGQEFEDAKARIQKLEDGKRRAAAQPVCAAIKNQWSLLHQAATQRLRAPTSSQKLSWG